MIREFEVRGRDFYFWHVTRNAIFRADLAGTSRWWNCRLILHCVASQALRIIMSRVLFERLVRIMACCAGYPAIIRIALAVKDAVRLKADIVDLHAPEKAELIAPAMTRGAKFLGQFIAAEPAGVKDQVAA